MSVRGTLPTRPTIAAELVAEDVDDYLRDLPAWEIECTQLSKGRFFGQTRYLKYGDLELFEKATRGVVLQSGCTPSGTLTLGIPQSQSSPAGHNGQQLAEGDMIVLTPSSEFELRTPAYFNFLAVSVSLPQVIKHLDSDCAVRFKDFTPGNSFVLSGIQTAILAAEIRRLLFGPDQIGESADSHCLATPESETLLQAIADSLSCDVSRMNAHEITESHRRIVSRARHYIESMIDVPLKVSEICQHVGAARRTLQYCFIEVLGITPLAYIKAIRLKAARKAIKGAHQHRLEIGDIAFQSGFTHLSRFARDYKRTFGELPSQTRSQVNSAVRMA